MSMQHDKATLRSRMRAWRDGLGTVELDALSEEVEARVVTLPAFTTARTICMYMHIGSEVRTGGYIARALLTGKRLVLPRVEGGNLELCHVTNPVHDLTAGGWGIMEPNPECEVISPREVNLFLLPGLAFDAMGRRLGYGKGFFDRLLVQSAGVRVALALEGQIVENVPANEDDQLVQWVVTPDRVIDCRTPGANIL
ncbi:MAG: 5-formyltetrahydrofolate cyclo-ligase [Nitrospirota bacterium]|nr:5-formyltetrahydrofolate cyclo-ligase [Nitrospirota bacterium]